MIDPKIGSYQDCQEHFALNRAAQGLLMHSTGAPSRGHKTSPSINITRCHLGGRKAPIPIDGRGVEIIADQSPLPLRLHHLMSPLRGGHTAADDDDDAWWL
ncbi:uncharacterized protein LAJ45_10479 [Morchella importuna]|uniref:uncharacterized protein n=1 Tax=Morchella importuna TaxID=1174673 RepID=UPI001E8DFF9D|nr:uncharacterized protein LAJ45_10479 [Morchella importuna]KAH8145509.1 hypothetical protein LAJ45_10479 [Morchella importuna]